MAKSREQGMGAMALASHLLQTSSFGLLVASRNIHFCVVSVLSEPTVEVFFEFLVSFDLFFVVKVVVFFMVVCHRRYFPVGSFRIFYEPSLIEFYG